MQGHPVRIPDASSISMRSFLDSFNSRFAAIDRRSRFILEMIDEGDLYRRPREIAQTMSPFSCGEYLLRSAAAVEQTYGGISTRLWDDPFEWTLPEKLATRESVIAYLDEVEATRKRGAFFLSSDDELAKNIPSPEKLRSIFDLLLETVAKAEHHQERAISIFQFFSDTKVPRL